MNGQLRSLLSQYLGINIIFTPDAHIPGYNVTIDENTPVGLTIFRGIQAVDRDRPNSPNSDIAYSIVAGNEDRKFSLEAGGQKAVVVLRKPLDLEAGDALFNMTILAQVCILSATVLESLTICTF